MPEPMPCGGNGSGTGISPESRGRSEQPSPAGRSLRKNWPRGRQGQSPSKCSRRAIAQCRWRLATALRALARSLGFHIRTRPPAARPELATRFDAYQVGCTRTQPAGEAVSHLSHRQPRLPPDVSEYGSLPHLPARSFRPHQSRVFHRVRIDAAAMRAARTLLERSDGVEVWKGDHCVAHLSPETQQLWGRR